jgi:hypothetical protein
VATLRAILRKMIVLIEKVLAAHLDDDDVFL